MLIISISIALILGECWATNSPDYDKEGKSETCMDYKFDACTYEEQSCRANPCAGHYKSFQVFEITEGKWKIFLNQFLAMTPRWNFCHFVNADWLRLQCRIYSKAPILACYTKNLFYNLIEKLIKNICGKVVSSKTADCGYFEIILTISMKKLVNESYPRKSAGYEVLLKNLVFVAFQL